mmetsp:Transcript_51291/g.166305  ORF Transcript_51291/g.166305 Transcript_51291/m.166305 type:complete len:270 (+) Transcript_51291:4100-4909(+)
MTSTSCFHPFCTATARRLSCSCICMSARWKTRHGRRSCVASGRKATPDGPLPCRRWDVATKPSWLLARPSVCSRGTPKLGAAKRCALGIFPRGRALAPSACEVVSSSMRSCRKAPLASSRSAMYTSGNPGPWIGRRPSAATLFRTMCFLSPAMWRTPSGSSDSGSACYAPSSVVSSLPLGTTSCGCIPRRHGPFRAQSRSFWPSSNSARSCPWMCCRQRCPMASSWCRSSAGTLPSLTSTIRIQGSMCSTRCASGRTWTRRRSGSFSCS